MLQRSFVYILLISISCAVVACGQETKTKIAQPTRSHGPELAAARLDPTAIAELDSTLQQHVDRGDVPGVVVMIVRGDTVGYLEEFGSRDLESGQPLKRDTLLRIYSMSKPIVAAAAMAIWEEGKFKLDDPISDRLPEWKDMTVKGGAKAVPVTPRHLMTHCAGLSYEWDNSEWETRDPTHEVTLDEFSKKMVAQPLEFQPGTQYLYGYSIDILGRYLEAIEGKPLDKIMRERMLDPLKMDDTEFWIRDEADMARTAQIYGRGADNEPKITIDRGDLIRKPKAMLGGQGLVSTTDDYARFCAMLLGGGELDGVRVLDTATVDLMFENHIDDIDDEYGLGGWADGSGGYAWGGYAGTTFYVNRKTNVYVIYMVQIVGYRSPTHKAFDRIVRQATGE